MDSLTFASLFDVSSLDMRVWILIANVLMTLLNFGFIVAIVISIVRFRRKVSVQDKSRIEYLEEFKVYIKNMFDKLDNIKLQLENVEKTLRDQFKGQ